MTTMAFHPKKSLGQNFLINPRVVEKIIEAADLKGDELVVEVGPGTGILTKELLKRAGKVIAIEKDRELFETLREALQCHPEFISGSHEIPKQVRNDTFSCNDKLHLLHADALTVPPPKESYVLVANIPYYITSPLLDHYIRENPENLPKRAVLLVQKEVAEKICAAPPRMNVLALHVQTFGASKIIATVSKNNFRPVPKVDSAIIVIASTHERSECASIKQAPRHGGAKQSSLAHYAAYFTLIHRAFAHKRKMLRSVFDEKLLRKAGINPTRRPETLTIEEWQKLTLRLTPS